MTIRKLPGDFDGSRIIEHALTSFDIRAVSVVDEGQAIGPHTHECAHFMVVLAGGYMRRDRQKAEVLRAPFLLFDPAGTTHSRRMARHERAASLGADPSVSTHIS